MPDREYHRLTFARPRRAGISVASERVALWLGADHLLCVLTVGYSETYKRFYFRDIQAITIRRTNRRMGWNIVFGICAGIFGLIALAMWKALGWPGLIGFGGFAAIFPSLILVNTLKGPTTLCHLRTAVQTEELSPLTRLRRAHKVLDRLRPLIAEAQGRMEPGDVQTLLNQLSASGGALPAYPQSAGAAAPVAPARSDDLPVP